jgi:membrane-associated phospholipid phosphatase
MERSTPRRGPHSMLAALVALAFALGSTSAQAEEQSTSRPRRQVRTELIVDGALAAVWLGLIPLALRDPVDDALIGPSFRGPEDIDALAAAADAGLIGRPMIAEASIDDAELIWAITGGLGSGLVLGGLATLFDGADQDAWWYGEQALAATLGMLQAVVGTFMLTQSVKNGVGRLRPDFADRADRYYCYQDPVPELYRARCGGLAARGELGPEVDADELRTGRQSFWSGHASMSAAALTYAALLVGGRMVWGRGSTVLTRTIGLLAQGAAMAAALFISLSRVSDGLHNIDDALVGSAVGFALAQASYWLHFDVHGEVRAGLSLHLAATDGGAVTGIAGRF